MTSPLADVHALTAEQQAVVDQPWDARVLVTAGPGAGKTYTLVRRVDALVQREELEAAEILVLSFSRAAVRELTDRIARHAAGARRVRAQTFDSWASALLLRAYPDTEWGTSTYDQRIAAATEAIERGAVEAGDPGIPAHVVIDEVQDLLGVRREMVETLLDRYQDHCGFTVVGDSAQGVYGFQVSDPEQRAAETDRFLDWIRVTFGEDLVELHLGENFRARSQDARLALSVGTVLQQLPRDREEAVKKAEQIHGGLRSQLAFVPNFGELDEEFVQAALRDYPGSTAILCRDNGQALTLSGRLADAGVPHTLQRSAGDRSAPVWVAALLTATSAPTLNFERFSELSREIDLPDGTDVASLWLSLRRAARGRHGTIDTAALHRALVERRLPDELVVPRPSSLVISTVHRAKGLEFDRVLVVEPHVLKEPRRVDKKKYDYDPAAEARLLYVALTRARDDLYVIDAPVTWQVRKDRRLDRWYLGGRSAWARNGIEMTADDVSREHPPGAEEIHEDCGSLQTHLRTHVTPGCPVELTLLHGVPVAPDQSPPYVLVAEGRRIGVVSEAFRTALHRMLDRGRRGRVETWPPLITGTRIDCVESVGGSSLASEWAGLGDSGAWLAPRLSGLGRFQWHAEPVGPDGREA